MYFQDHNPPHFHAAYQDMEAEYSISTLEILAGRLPSRAHAMVKEWASLHQEELTRNWEKSRVPSGMEKIEPLK